jgi:hypothetical protein
MKTCLIQFAIYGFCVFNFCTQLLQAQCAINYAGLYGTTNCESPPLDTDTCTFHLVNDSLIRLALDFSPQPNGLVDMKIFCDLDSVYVPYHSFNGVGIYGYGHINNGVITVVYHVDTPVPDYDVCRVYDTSLGIAKAEQKHEFIIYPNPASDIVNIKFNGVSNRLEGTIALYNLYGQLISQYIVSNSLNIDVEGLPSGFYFLDYVNEKNEHLVE